ncbi:MAG: T9SS type A sorting domain-containing protein, partial [Flavobacteriales bacterium]
NEDNLNITCQNCHMPSLGSKQPIKLVAGLDTPFRSPFSLHTFAGANTLMLSILDDNKEALGVPATTEDFEASIDATFNMLQAQSLSLSTELIERTADTLIAKVDLTNLAGHKFPSGYPARRMFIHAALYNADGSTLWESGEWDDEFYLTDEDEDFEQHYDVIRSEDEVQIYEMVMGDVNGDYTSLLERASSKLKDNRLVPRGFSTSHFSYDTTTVIGAAFDDLNFNFEDGSEGTGGDVLEFRIPTFGFDDDVVLEINAYYQAIPPKFVEDLFDYEDPDIAAFEAMYMAADRTPVLLRSSELIVDEFVGIEEKGQVSEYLSHASGSQVLSVASQQKSELSIYSNAGALVQKMNLDGGNQEVLLEVSNGIYIAVLTIGGERETLKFFVRR